MECCRICLSSDNLTSIFENEGIASNITAIASVDITQNDGLPQHICLLCKHELDISISFREKCESTFEMLKQQHAKEIEVKEEIILNLLSGGSILNGKLPEQARKRVLDAVKNNVMHNIVADDSQNDEGDTITITDLTCVQCRVSFSSDKSFLSHLKRLHSSTMTQCEICMLYFPSGSVLQDHLEEKHDISNGSIFRCKMCDKAYDLQSQLNSHLCIPLGEQNYKCGLCQVHFALDSALENHICDSRRKVEPTFKMGSKSFKSHKNRVRTRCSKCGRLISWRSHVCEYNEEANACKTSPYVCSICRQAFRRENELENHLLLHKNLIKCTKEKIYVFRG